MTLAICEFRRLTCITAATIALIAGTGLAMAQQAEQKPDLRKFGPRVNQPTQTANAPKPEIAATHGDWTIQCETPSKALDAGGEAKKACGMVQTAQDEKRKNIGLTIILRKDKKDDATLSMMQVIAPIGVYLPLGVALEIDGAAVGRVPFTRCAPQLCIAVAEASPPTLEKLKKGSSANFTIYEAPGLGLPITISLTGFTAAYDDLDNYR